MERTKQKFYWQWISLCLLLILGIGALYADDTIPLPTKCDDLCRERDYWKKVLGGYTFWYRDKDCEYCQTVGNCDADTAENSTNFLCQITEDKRFAKGCDETMDWCPLANKFYAQAVCKGSFEETWTEQKKEYIHKCTKKKTSG